MLCPFPFGKLAFSSGDFYSLFYFSRIFHIGIARCQRNVNDLVKISMLAPLNEQKKAAGGKIKTFRMVKHS